jgi:hypothetical protein
MFTKLLISPLSPPTLSPQAGLQLFNLRRMGLPASLTPLVLTHQPTPQSTHSNHRPDSINHQHSPVRWTSCRLVVSTVSCFKFSRDSFEPAVPLHCSQVSLRSGPSQPLHPDFPADSLMPFTSSCFPTFFLPVPLPGFPSDLLQAEESEASCTKLIKDPFYTLLNLQIGLITHCNFYLCVFPTTLLTY